MTMDDDDDDGDDDNHDHDDDDGDDDEDDDDDDDDDDHDHDHPDIDYDYDRDKMTTRKVFKIVTIIKKKTMIRSGMRTRSRRRRGVAAGPHDALVVCLWQGRKCCSCC